MSSEELEAWASEHPAILAYFILLLVASLVSLIFLVSRIGQLKTRERQPISAWPLTLQDFLLFLLTLIIWYFGSGFLVYGINAFVTGNTDQAASGTAILGSYLFQVGMLYIFLIFRFHFRSPNEGSVSPRIMTLDRGLLLGLFYFLAFLPVIYGVGASWNLVLEFLRKHGIEIDLPLQDAVVLFQQTESPLFFFALLLLAVVVAPVVEESVFRAGIYRFLKGKIPVPLALLISGLIFGMIHGNLQSLPGLVAVGVSLGLAYELSGNLRVSIFFHAFFNLNSIIWILVVPDYFTS